MGTLGKANSKGPLWLGESVTPKGRDGLTKACSDGKPMQIFGCMRLTEMIGLKKILEEPTEFKLLFVQDNIRIRCFSTNQSNSQLWVQMW
jgi:hypothetical protein